MPEIKSNKDEFCTGLKKVAQYGVPEIAAAMEYDVGSEDFMKYFEEEILESMVFQGGAVVRFFEGAFGSGKTHLLELIKELALNNNMAIALTELSHDLNLDDWRHITRYVLENLEARIDGEKVRSLPDIVQALKRSGQGNSKWLKDAALPHAGFQRAMLILFENSQLTDQARDKIVNYLRGERIGAGELARSGIKGVKGPLSQRNAEQVLKTVLGGLFLLGLNGTILLFDETEQGFRVSRNNPSRKVRMSANLMRRLVDGSASGTLVGTGVIFAVLPGFIEACGSAYQALGQRLETPRDLLDKNPWRQPVLTMNSVSSIRTPEEFLDAACTKFVALVKYYGGQTDGLYEQMLNQGEQILQNDASSGYRRSLMKLLAAIAMERIERGGEIYGGNRNT